MNLLPHGPEGDLERGEREARAPLLDLLEAPYSPESQAPVREAPDQKEQHRLVARAQPTGGLHREREGIRGSWPVTGCPGPGWRVLGRGHRAPPGVPAARASPSILSQLRCRVTRWKGRSRQPFEFLALFARSPFFLPALSPRCSRLGS